MSASPERRSALLVPLPEVEPAVGDLREHYDPVAQHGVPAHVTVLYPFLPPERIDDSTLHTIDVALIGATEFTTRFERVERFPGGVLYLAPVDAEPFRALTARLAPAFPDHPPYGGRFDAVVPHLTVVDCDTVDLDPIETAVRALLPLEAHAREVLLIVEGEDQRWTVRHRVALAPASRSGPRGASGGRT